ncbi:uncharacterized protein Fot_21568 [Forsythia ovata]|uniref:PWWP domain-containing protein n=1 Tax=Forsythia ovata TaxID=205694 RepID=A0ABD1UVI0_9LAMI
MGVGFSTPDDGMGDPTLGIYDPQDASSFAGKHIRMDRLLVAFFGDGSFSWCLPAQLIPFATILRKCRKKIEGLEDTSDIGDVVANYFDVPILGPLEDDCVSSPSTDTGKSSVPSVDKIYHRRKRKSVTPDINPKNKQRTTAKEIAELVNSTSAIRKKRTGTDG